MFTKLTIFQNRAGKSSNDETDEHANQNVLRWKFHFPRKFESVHPFVQFTKVLPLLHRKMFEINSYGYVIIHDYLRQPN